MLAVKYAFYRFLDQAAWIARILADVETAAIAAIHRGQSTFNVSLAGGKTPEPVYRSLASDPSLAALSARISFHLWVGDEREVPADSPLRNGRMIASVFGDGAGAACAAGAALAAAAATPAAAPCAWTRQPVLHLWPEGEAGKACAAYAREIAGMLGASPAFDLAILGMGADGHTAGLFSAEDAASRDPAGLTLKTTAPSEPRSRMTMSASLLSRSRDTMILVSGREKKPMIEAVLAGGIFPLALAAGPGAAFYYWES